jgi:hypothetical protein
VTVETGLFVFHVGVVEVLDGVHTLPPIKHLMRVGESQKALVNPGLRLYRRGTEGAEVIS